MGRLLRYFRMSLNPLRAFTIFAQDPAPSTITPFQLYDTSEVDTGSTWRDGRAIFRKVVNFGGLPNGAQKTVVHNVPAPVVFVHMWGIGMDALGVSMTPLPSADPANTFLAATGTVAVVETISDMTAYTNSFVVLDYVKGQPI